MRTVSRRVLGLVTVALVALLPACGDDDGPSDGSSPTTTTTTATAGVDLDGDGSTTSSTADADGDVIEVSVSGGAVTGGGRHEIALGDTVTLHVTSDVVDHVHVHGYDLMVDVGPGVTAHVAFDARIPGVFEVELEGAGIRLLELEIS